MAYATSAPGISSQDTQTGWSVCGGELQYLTVGPEFLPWRGGVEVFWIP